MSNRYQRIPTEIEATQWTGTIESCDEIHKMGAIFITSWQNPSLVNDAQLLAGKFGAQGIVVVPVGHWIAKLTENDFYPISPEVFAAIYVQIEP